MTMHLVRGVTSLNTRKRKAKKKSQRQLQAEADHAAFLARLGVDASKKPRKPRKGVYDAPDLHVDRSMTSDKIPAHGPAKERNRYTGDEIAGIVVTHKSNLMPVRKDNKQAAIDAATMRRN